MGIALAYFGIKKAYVEEWAFIVIALPARQIIKCGRGGPKSLGQEQHQNRVGEQGSMGTKSMGTKLDQKMPIIDIIKIQISDYYFVKWHIDSVIQF